MRDGEPWTLRRTLNLGTRNTSEPILTDQYGNRHLMREIMPQLDSVDAGEGTHIIFAPQSAPLRRQPADLEPFERTVFNYLGLTHPRALLSNIEEFLEDQTEVEDKLGEELTEARKRIDGQINDVETRRDHILSIPPWGNGPTPSIAASEQKARGFIEEFTGKHPDLVGVSLDALLEAAEKSLNERRTQDQGSLEKEASELAKRRGRLEDLRDVQDGVSAQESVVKATQANLDTALDGLTFDELQEKLKAAKCQADTESIKRGIVQAAIDLIDRDESETIHCPICGSPHGRQILELTLQNTTNHPDNELNSKVNALETRLQKSKNLRNSFYAQKSLLSTIKQHCNSRMNLLDDNDKRKLVETDDIDQLINSYSEREAVIKAQLDDHETWFTSKHAQLDKLNEESRFHHILKDLTTLQARRMELGRGIDSYKNLVSFGESVRTIREVIQTRLNDQLAKDIPRVSDTLSKAFSTLTHHPWYDRLIISEYTLPKLELRVASSHDPIGREDPTGVLNGQAESALNLVPYFAFSQADDTPTEVYLVMLDDPTRASDTEHIRILVERLRELGRNVQLIVASQETERLETMIPDVFDDGSYIIIEPTGWSPDSGPNLKVKYE